jgi:RimJ/RimL family protein N-acetyltransferase
MRHDLRMDGYSLRLRPIGDADAGFVVQLRGDPSLNRHLHAGAASTAAQVAWFAEYYTRAGDFYFIAENRQTGSPEGVIGVYDASGGWAEWGRWIMRHGSLAATESAWLIYRVGFELLGLDGMYCRTVAENAGVVSFHDSCGIRERRVIPDCFEIGGRRVDAVEHRVDRSTWAEVEPSLNRLAGRLARRAPS